ncbi:MAG: bifunctional diguanylate cyclase/phosphodiesterase [Leptospiraceae bacterium]
MVLSLGLWQASLKASRISFIRYWASGIALVSLRYLVWMLEPVIGRPLSQFLGEMAHSVAMYLIFFGATRLTGIKVSRYSIVLVLLISGGWLYFTSFVHPEFLWRTTPVYIFAGLSLFFTARLFWLLKEKHPGTGYGFACTAAVLWGAHKLNYPVLRPIEAVAPFGFMGAVALMTYLSISLLIIGQNRRRSLLDRLARAAAFNANHDLLTELPNRRHMMTSMTRRTYSQTEFHLILVDLKNLGQLNDSWGREVADRVLINAARRLEQILPEKTLLSRVGGKQFAIITEASSLSHIMQLVLQAWKTPLVMDRHRVNLELRMGACTFPEEGSTADELYRHASLALADAKNAGIEHRTFGELRSTEVLRRLELKRDLYEAHEREEMFCVYQPQYDLRSNEMVGAEALLRWNHPRFGEISPGIFIPIAESSGAILKLGEFVLETVLQDLKGSELPENFRISVNLSPMQFTQENLVGTLLSKIEESGVSPGRLEFEITESTIFHDVDFVDRMLRDMGQEGIEFAIDDFGTGYSSLSILKALPVHRLKIDRSFVRDMDRSFQDRSIVEMMVYLAHTLQLTIIAEGVENDAQKKLLQDMGCDQLQGFLMAEPMPFGELQGLWSAGSTAKH